MAVTASVAGGVLVVVGAAVPASAAQGQVVVFSTENAPLDKYDDPSGCNRLPDAAHVLDNLTDKPVTIYGDPQCLSPGAVVDPGYGSHVPAGSGSFSV
jgi:hypothetical protein